MHGVFKHNIPSARYLCLRKEEQPTVKGRSLTLDKDLPKRACCDEQVYNSTKAVI